MNRLLRLCTECNTLQYEVLKVSDVSIRREEDDVREEVEDLGSLQRLFSCQSEFGSFNTCFIF